jgi:hypothetical protein
LGFEVLSWQNVAEMIGSWSFCFLGRCPRAKVEVMAKTSVAIYRVGVDKANLLRVRSEDISVYKTLAGQTSVLSRKAQRKRQGFPALLPYTRFDASPRIRFLPMPGRQYGNCRQERILTIASYDSGNRIHNAIQISGFGPQLGGCRDLTSSPLYALSTLISDNRPSAGGAKWSS